MIPAERVLRGVEGFTRGLLLLPPKREPTAQLTNTIYVARSTSPEALVHHLHHGSVDIKIEGEAFPDREEVPYGKKPMTYELLPFERKWQPEKPVAIETAPSRAVTLWKRPKAA